MQHVLLICAHEPSLDPRIRWEAEAAKERDRQAYRERG